MDDSCVIIAGGGIGGLATALTLHQIGVPCVVFEAVRDMRPLGVGINLQPNAVRELYDLGLTQDDLDRVGLPAKEWALVGLNGNDIYSEQRGLLAGYNWPQYAVHRGQFHVLLHQKVLERIGPDAVRLGSRVTGYRKNGDGGVTAFVERADGSRSDVSGSLLIGADGIHSAIRAQMHPAQPPIHWGGAVMWRGTTWGKPIRTGASFVGLGTHRIGLLNLVDERCGGTFNNIDDVIPPQERIEFMAGYRAAAGFAIEQLNSAPPTIAPGARVHSARRALA
jgi:5-methylphenazine-1-carboxylate 1-monooxygenase